MLEDTPTTGEQTSQIAVEAPPTQAAEQSSQTTQGSSGSDNTIPLPAQSGTSATEQPLDAKADPGKNISDALAAFANEGAQVKIPEKKQPAAQQQATQQDTQQQQPVQQPDQSKRRDYSGLNDDERRYFRDMDAKSFAYLKPIYLEYKQLKSEVTQLRTQSTEAAKATFYENPDAYQLTPEYRQTDANLKLVSNEKTFWKQQLANVRNGNKWVALVGYDQQGNPRYSAEQEPTAEAEADIVDALQVANQIHFELNSKINGIRDNHVTQHKGYLNKMSDIEKQIFKDADTEMLNKAMQTKLTLFPEYRRGNPEVQLVAKLLAVIDGYAMLLDEKKAAAITAEAKTRTLANGGPPPGARIATGGNGKTAGAIMDEFNKARAAGVF